MLFTSFVSFLIYCSCLSPIASASTQIDVSVVVPSFSDNTLPLHNLLHSIFLAPSSSVSRARSVSDLNIEVVVIEAGSIDGAKHYRRHDAINSVVESYQAMGFPVVFRHSDEIGKASKLSEALNAAVCNHTSGLYVLFLHEAVELQPRFLEMMYRQMNMLEKEENNVPAPGEEPSASKSRPSDSLSSPSASSSPSAPSPQIGLLGSKLIYPHGAIYHAGIGFSLSKMPKESNAWWWEEEEAANVPVPYLMYQGFNHLDARTRKVSDVPALSLASLMVSRSFFLESLHGFNTSMPESLISIDLSLRTKYIHQRRVVISPDAVGIYFGLEERWSKEADVKPIAELYGQQIAKDIRDGYKIKNLTLVWNMECGRGAVLGFTTEALGFLASLHNKVNLKAEVNNLQGCREDMETVGMPVGIIRMLERLSDTSIEGEYVLVMHRDPGRYTHFLTGAGAGSRKGLPLLSIGRSMYETDRIPSDWLSKCNELVDEIWVPSHFNVETFSKAGVDATKLDVVPEPLDSFMFDPDITTPLSLALPPVYTLYEEEKGEIEVPLEPGEEAEELEETNEEDISAPASSPPRDTDDPLFEFPDLALRDGQVIAEQEEEARKAREALEKEERKKKKKKLTKKVEGPELSSVRYQGKDHFRFLAIMKWEERKNWKTLLRAYWDEFDVSEAVTLIFRSNVDNNGKEQYKTWRNQIKNELRKFHLAPVQFLLDPIPTTKLPSLYKACNAVVLATHGEGWGLPLIEGMSMQLPVISTNWSGSTEFMRSDNSYLIPVSELVNSTTQGHLWAEPDYAALRAAMRRAVTDREESKEVGKIARSFVSTHFDHESVGNIVLDKLKAYEKRAAELSLQRQQREEILKDKKEKYEEGKKGLHPIKIVET